MIVVVVVIVRLWERWKIMLYRVREIGLAFEGPKEIRLMPTPYCIWYLRHEIIYVPPIM